MKRDHPVSARQFLKINMLPIRAWFAHSRGE
jgi:hypothetical protein